MKQTVICFFHVVIIDMDTMTTSGGPPGVVDVI